MGQMNISITEQLKSWCEARVAEGRYSSTSDYVRDLIRRDQERVAQLEALEAALEVGERSGISSKTIKDIIAEGNARHAARG